MIRYLKIGQTYVLSWPRYGFHLGSAKWWRPLVWLLPAVWQRLMLSRSKP